MTICDTILTFSPRYNLKLPYVYSDADMVCYLSAPRPPSQFLTFATSSKT